MVKWLAITMDKECFLLLDLTTETKKAMRLVSMLETMLERSEKAMEHGLGGHWLEQPLEKSRRGNMAATHCILSRLHNTPTMKVTGFSQTCHLLADYYFHKYLPDSIQWFTQ